jgi:AAA15 family ATPase/GTPase
MYTNLKIQNFRGFKKLEIEGIKRINLIAGMNDTGKTSLLEAIYLNAGKNPHFILSINGFRGINKAPFFNDATSEMPWESVFYDADTSKKVKISGYWNSTTRTIEVSVKSSNVDLSYFYDVDASGNKFDKLNPTVNMAELNQPDTLILKYIGNKTEEVYELRMGSNRIISNKQTSPDFATYFYRSNNQPTIEDAELFGKLDVLSEIDNVTDILQIIEPRLKRLSVIVLNREPIIHGDIGLSKLLPLPLMGEGLGRLMGIILRIANAKGGVVLIDEIENGFHYSVSEKIWHAIDEVSKRFNVQIFATTHSYECINYAYRAFSKNSKNDFAFFRLDRNKENVIAKSFDEDTLKYAIESDSEVR